MNRHHREVKTRQSTTAALLALLAISLPFLVCGGCGCAVVSGCVLSTRSVDNIKKQAEQQVQDSKNKPRAVK